MESGHDNTDKGLDLLGRVAGSCFLRWRNFVHFSFPSDFPQFSSLLDPSLLWTSTSSVSFFHIAYAHLIILLHLFPRRPIAHRLSDTAAHNLEYTTLPLTIASSPYVHSSGQ